ncbi:efflux RND transporter periplasmic adaptor subunit [Falsiroseomonas selenitidurans]|uniref:Efflux RND transporter periplasmic adaptor subunit n=1 Tax=Falsiroseomonas selenitidurans TaxID=2716335 RepID=A0ABX1E483_9PROT|nr:efflux RND transporter periplasmic adaptor subunit [Falsiroseomonas selenitidurans]NKC31515.1 efflux RND transporter periplasmic adaptor subunit [Falsiroseomonas selenitidurans]
MALIVGLGTAWHVFGEKVGLPRPLALVGLEAAAPGPAQRGGAGGPVGVAVAPVRVAAVVDRTEAVGTVRARNAVTVTAKVTGIVTRIRFEEGQMVREGDQLVDLEAAALRAELDQARALHDDARSQAQRARQLQPGQSIAAQRLETLEALARQAEGRVRQTAARLEELRVAAPFAGRVGLRQVSVGALLQPGTVVTTLDDIEKVRVEFAVPEVFLARVRVGSQVTARSSAFGDRRFTGTVAVVDTRIDTSTRTVRVISEFDNTDEALKPGLFMTVELVLATRPNALLIPEEAIDPLGGRAFVYAIRDNRARRLEVRLGQRLSGEVEVVSGIEAGDVVVVRGLQRLRNDVPVRVTETLTRPTS